MVCRCRDLPAKKMPAMREWRDWNSLPLDNRRLKVCRIHSRIFLVEIKRKLLSSSPANPSACSSASVKQRRRNSSLQSVLFICRSASNERFVSLWPWCIQQKSYSHSALIRISFKLNKPFDIPSDDIFVGCGRLWRQPNVGSSQRRIVICAFFGHAQPNTDNTGGTCDQLYFTGGSANRQFSSVVAPSSAGHSNCSPMVNSFLGRK